MIAVRRLLRHPAFSIAAVLTLALGIGATTAVFSLVDGVLLRPLPWSHPDQLVYLSHVLAVSGATAVDQSDASFLHYRASNRVFSEVAGYREGAVNLASGDTPERVNAARVSAGTFAMLGITPLRGRLFTSDEDRPGAARVVVLGEALWRRLFDGDQSIVGRTVDIDGAPSQVIGILPRSASFPSSAAELWVPLALDPANTESSTFDMKAVARMRPGISIATAQANLQELLLTLPAAYPGRLSVAAINATHMQTLVRPLRDVIVGDVRRVLWVVLAAAAFVLLVACANVTNLFLVRADARRPEMAIRLALGAERKNIVAEFLSEGVLISLAGGLLGIALAVAGTGVLRSLDAGRSIPRLDEIGVNGTVLLVAAGVTVLAALVVSLVPALRRSGRTSRPRFQGAMVVVQVALGLVLVSGAGLMARSLERLRAVAPGFDAEHAWTMRIALPAAAYPTSASEVALLDNAMEKIRKLPGAQRVGVITKLPLVDEARQDTALFVPDRQGMGTIPNVHQVTYVNGDYFAAMGIPMVEGASFGPIVPDQAPLQVIVSHALAERYWGDSSAIGRLVRTAPRGPLYTIVGVAGDVRGTKLEDAPDQMIYLPLIIAPGFATEDGGVGPVRFTPRDLAIVVRTATGTELGGAVRQVMHDLAPELPLYGTAAMTDIVTQATARTRFTLLLLGVASGVALLLGAVGLHGVMAYTVSRRNREIAVRIALGATPARVGRMVTRQALALAAAGVVIGLAGSIALSRFLAALVFGIAPTDILALAGAASLMMLVSAAASWLPARRAAAVHPAQTLRTI